MTSAVQEASEDSYILNSQTITDLDAPQDLSTSSGIGQSIEDSQAQINPIFLEASSSNALREFNAIQNAHNGEQRLFA